MISASGLPTVACVVITKNEEANIQDCLKSVRWADELVVVDAESRDKTVELARACGAKVSVRPWPGFGLQKNFGMAQASSDWILILDADERVTEELCGEVKTCLAGWRPGVPVAYRIPRRNFFTERGSEGAVSIPIIKCACFGGEPLGTTMSPCMKISSLTERLGRWSGTSIITLSVAFKTTSRSSGSIPRWRHRRRPRRFGRLVGRTWSSVPSWSGSKPIY